MSTSSRQELSDRIGATMSVSLRDDSNARNVLRLRGLPYSADVQEIRNFFMVYSFEAFKVWPVTIFEK